jgi:hypothetical protein
MIRGPLIIDGQVGLVILTFAEKWCQPWLGLLVRCVDPPGHDPVLIGGGLMFRLLLSSIHLTFESCYHVQGQDPATVLTGSLTVLAFTSESL